MSKTYSENVSKITSEDLLKGLIGHGLFTEKLPNFLSSEAFFQYCLDYKKKKKKNFKNEPHDYIRYNSMRDINIPRSLAIPNPFAYANLCFNLSDNWEEIKKFFEENTNKQDYKVSRIHIRKLENTDKLFEMNYKNIEKDGVPEQLLVIKSRYIVEADISNCFPSMYTHAIPWALVGKEEAKKERKNKKWFNKMDSNLRNLKNGETNGFLIGPHSSNIFSEIILTKIDHSLWEKGYRYIRHIDDYTCYLESREKANDFLLDLVSELKKFELSLNAKKIKIIELPKPANSNWINKINSFYIGDKFYNHDSTKRIIFNLKRLKSFLDMSLELAQEEGRYSVLNYSIKVIAKTFLGKEAKKYYINRIHHLLLSYPYLANLMEDYLFSAFKVETPKIKEFAQDLYDEGLDKRFYEACSYAIYWCLIHDVDIEKDVIKDSIEGNDCIFLLISYLLAKKYEKKYEVDKLKEEAEKLKKNDSDRFWLFIYEVLSEPDDLPEEFKELKKEKISFVKNLNATTREIGKN